MRYPSSVAIAALAVTFAATAAGAAVFTNGSGLVYAYNDAGQRTSTQASSEEFADVEVGPDGFIYATSNILGHGSVQRIDPQSRVVTDTYFPVPDPAYSVPLGIAFNATGTMYVGANRIGAFGATAVLRLDKNAGKFVPFALPPATAGETVISDVAVGPNGDVYAGIGGVGVVRYHRVTGASLGVVVAASDDHVFGYAAARINFGPDGKLYVDDLAGNLNRFDPVTGASLGTLVSASSGVPHSVDGFSFGRDGKLYIASGSTGQILRYDALTGAFIDVFSSDPGTIRSRRWEAVYVPEPASAVTVAAIAATLRRRRRV